MTKLITDRIDNITKIPQDYLRVDPPAPRSVKIELTGRCNYRCEFCALRIREKQPTGNMDWELFKRITREMREEGVEEIGLFYIGESFMAPDLLVDAIEYLKINLMMPYVFLTSNASIAKGEYVRRCMMAGLDSLKWSVNAADEEQFVKVMGVKAKLFEAARNNIKAAWKIRELGNFGTKLYASTILYDGEQREKMQALLDEHVLPFVDEHYFLPLYGQMTHWNTHRSEELGYEPTAGNQGRIGALREPLPCWAVFTEGHVTSEGLLSACCFDSDGRFSMSDLKTTSFRDGWKSEVFQELRKAHLAKNVKGTPCEGCIAYSGIAEKSPRKPQTIDAHSIGVNHKAEAQI